MTTIYIAGPMTGQPSFNYPAFFAAAAAWEALGWQVHNPAVHDAIDADQMDPDEARAKFMRQDIEWVMDSDAIAVLPGWWNSKGARVEVAIANVLLLPVHDALKPQEPPNGR